MYETDETTNGAGDNTSDEEVELAAQFEYYGASCEEADQTARRMLQDLPF